MYCQLPNPPARPSRQPMTLDKNNSGGFDTLFVPPFGGFMKKASFGDLFCETNKCSPDEFCEKVFWFCLYPQALLLARLIWRLNRAYFRPDVEFIEQVRNLTSSTEVREELNRFRYYHRATGLLRGYLKVRISGKHVLNLADGLFSKAG